MKQTLTLRWGVLLWVCLSAPALLFSQLPVGFSVSKVQDGYAAPAGLIFSAAGQQMFVWELSGKIYVSTWNGTSYVKQSAPVLDISPEVGGWRDFGLMSVALDPNFSTNGFVYLLYTVDRHHLLNFGAPAYNASTNDYFKASIHRITRYRIQNNAGNWSTDYNSRKILLGESKSTGVPLLHESHGVGTLLFGKDGTLLVSTGDNASYSSTDVGSASETYFQQAISDGIIRAGENVGAFRAQMLTSLCGKILRLDPSTGDGIPSNPYYDGASPRSARSRVWGMGLRNPFRMGIWPGTGSSTPSEANPGALLVGDVGWNTWEDFHVISQPAENCGWPWYEGQDAISSYATPGAALNNTEEPNPTNSCNKPWFTFDDLINQGRPNNNDGATAALPCNNGAPAGNQRRFFHNRPALSWKHGVDETFFPAFSGASAVKYALGTNNVPGTPFKGNSSTGGVFYNGSSFPPAWQNGYFFGDYGANWIKFAVLGQEPGNWVKEVKNFAPEGFANGIVDLEYCPLGGTLFFVNINSGEIMRISYGGNLPPIAAASANTYYGPGPLAVNFSSAGSLDPNGSALTYLWEFGDGTTSTQANPVKTFTGTGVKKFTVKLTVTDNAGLSDSRTLVISLNNTPPIAKINNPSNGSLYTMSGSGLVQLLGSVTDNDPTGMAYKWQVSLRHNNHAHTEPEMIGQNATFNLTPIGCDGNTYYYFILLTTTDNGGLISRDSVKLYPDCSNSLAGGCKGAAGAGLYREVWTNITGSLLTNLTGNSLYPASPDIREIAAYSVSPWNVMDNYGTRLRGYVTPSQSGLYTFTVTGDDQTELYLSTTSNPALKTRIAYVTDWTNNGELTKYVNQRSASIALTAGQDYYIELLHKEGTGGDGWGIYWTPPGAATPIAIPVGLLSPLSTVCNSCTPPVANCKNATVTLTGASVSLTASEIDNGSTAGSCGVIASRTLSQTTFTAAGFYPVTLTVTNDGGQSTSCSASVAVNASPPPPTGCDGISIVPGAGTITISGLTAPKAYVHVFNAGWSTVFSCANCDLPVQEVNGLAAGNYFVKVELVSASWSVICKKEQTVAVTSGGGGTGLLSFSAVSNLSAAAAPGQNTAMVTFQAPNATTTCLGQGVVVSQTSGLTSGSAFPVGVTTNTYSATDACGNQKTTSFTVTVTSSGTGNCDAIAFTPGNGAIAISGLSSPIRIVQVFNSTWQKVFSCSGACGGGNSIDVTGLAPGVYYCKATLYTAGWQSICEKNQTVTVGGSASPTLTLADPQPIAAVAPVGQNGVVVNYNLPAANSTCTLGSVAVALESGLPSGSVFPIGTSVVIFRATDGCGNAKTASMTVVVDQGAVGNDCSAVTITAGPGSITFGNLTAPVVYVQVFNSSWNTVHKCVASECSKPTHTVNNLPAGTYHTKVDFNTAGYVNICRKEQTVVAPAGSYQANFNDNALVFSAYRDGAGVLLKWISKNPGGTEFFALERESAPGTFELLNTLDVKDVTDDILYLEWLDVAPLPGLNRYRLTRINTTGGADQSEIRTVQMPEAGVRVFPNPATRALQVWLDEPEMTQGTVRLVNVLGVLVLEKKITASDGRMFDLDVSQLESGWYTLFVEQKGKRPLVEKVRVVRE